ncbi:fimbria major subunit [Prevotella copri]|uniref:fimbria major subunit n=1 Tax=Segatella copri TaxID=165179 RepID=UPI001C38FBF3|nr:fimbria major subunit [Segatella copri]MBV3402059.1 fimbria major subunit [Segatella copri]
MFKMKSIIRSLLVFLLVMSFTSCVRDNISDFPIANDNSKVFLSVSINVAGEDSRTTRAEDYYFEPKPWGGESGNGDHKGETYERTVNNMSMLFFHPAKNDLTDGEARIEKVIYFPNVSSDGTRTLAVEVDSKFLNDTKLRFLVVANVGDLSAYQGRKLSDVRDQLITDVFNRADNATFTKTGELDGYSTFVMSSHGQSSLTIKGGSGTEEDPYLIDHMIERLAARIDIMPHTELYEFNKKTGLCKYCYNVKQGTDIIGGFVLEYVRPYNVLTSQEYVFKRTATDASLANLKYLGLEEADRNKQNTNYVVDPTSLNKSEATFKYPKNTDEYWANATYDDFYQTRIAHKTHTNSIGGKATFNPETDYYILDYVKENTSFDNNEKYATGLVFKGKYYEADDWDATNVVPKTGHESNGKDKAYTYVIRHSDPTGAGKTSDPMHYGIVRNNIYRVRIDGITGKGPDGMKITLNVRKWATYTHDETTM